tara:strand:- start:1416 stop:2600 length:1185 start_codon:yes stop_codon:yes gene_type:complete
MATAPTYCTHRELKDVFPQVDSFDNKKALYGWNQLFTHGGNELYEADNTGLVTVLFKDGQDLTPYKKTENYTDSTANTDEAVDIIETAIDVTDGGQFSYGDIIKIDDEKMLVTNISSNTITVERGFLDTTTATHSTATDIYIGVSWTEENQWLYNSGCDSVLYYATTVNPNDQLIESGEDFSTLITRILANASRFLDAKLDPNLPKEQFKDKSGNYDYIIVRTTALIAATFLIRSHDPTSEVATALMEDAMGNIDALNKGSAALSWQTTGDSSKGVLRDVSYTSGSIRPVDTRGRYSGSWDLVKIIITTGGVLGTAKYSVFIKDTDKLKNQQVVTNEIISGDYQPLAGGLEIRFGGSADNSTATVDDEWECEVVGYTEHVDNSAINSIKMTRRF